jgi:hypothetical protein
MSEHFYNIIAVNKSPDMLAKSLRGMFILNLKGYHQTVTFSGTYMVFQFS